MRYHNITSDDMLNGDGLRVVLWVAGCGHRCEGCQNPSTWDPNGGIEFDESAKSELFAELGKSYISGITFSGGDPLYETNKEGIVQLICEIKERFPEKTIWLYTGYLWDQIKNIDVIGKIDVVVDGEFEKDKEDSNLHWCGSSNQRIINVKETIKRNNLVIYQ